MTKARGVVVLAGSAAVVSAVALVATAAPAAAHGLGGRSDLPLPVWMFSYGAAGALVLSFAALAVFWPTARLEGGLAGVVVPPAVPPVTEALAMAGRVVGLALYAVVLGAAAPGVHGLVPAGVAPHSVERRGEQPLLTLADRRRRRRPPRPVLAAHRQRTKSKPQRSGTR